MGEWPLLTIAQMIRELGDSGFTRKLLDALNQIAVVDHLAIIAFDQELTGHVVAAESIGKPLAQAVGRIYESARFYRHDPNATLIDSQTEQTDRPLMLRLRVRDIQNKTYRSEVFESINLVERLSFIDHFDGQWNCINLYRCSDSGLFSAADTARLEAASAVIVSLVGKHLALMPAPSWRRDTRPPQERLETLVRSLDSGLTARQIEVCARALAGMTNEAIGLDLGIQPPTVATLRKRAYAVLNISNLSELFALCLAGDHSNVGQH